MPNSASFVFQVALVALIAIVMRCVFTVKGTQLPRARDGARLYTIKWQWRILGFISVAFWIVVSVWSWFDLHRPDWGLIAISLLLVVLGLWLASGLVTTNETRIRKKVLWRQRSFEWKDITEIRLHKKQGGAIELRPSPQKLIVDFRFNAFHHLLDEIKDRTNLRPIGELS